MKDFPKGLSKDESLLLTNGSDASTGTFLLQHGKLASLPCAALSSRDDYGVQDLPYFMHIYGPKTRVKLEEYLTKYSR